MRIKANFVVAGLAAMLSVGAMGCKGEPPKPPVEFQTADEASNGLKVSVDAFELTTPDYISTSKQTVRPEEGQGEVAVVRLKFENPTDKPITYKPMHDHNPKGGVQLSTEPDPENNGARTTFKRVVLNGIYTTNQVSKNIEIQPKSEIYDDYLFENPGTLTEDHLVLLVPGEIFGDTTRDRPFRFKVPATPQKVTAPDPSGINTPVTIDGLSVVVTGVSFEQAELALRTPPAKKLQYPYAYTKEPILVVRVEITNKSSGPLSYDPSHTAAAEGIILELPGGIPLKRVKLSNETIGAGQVLGKVTVNPGESLKDLFFFEAPSSDAQLTFSLSGHIFGVRGMYRFALSYVHTTPEKPDLEPYKHANKAANADEAKDKEAADDKEAEAQADDAAAAPAE